MFIPLILAAGSLFTLISGAPVPSFLSATGTAVSTTHSLKERSSASVYTVYGGDGEVSDGWPALSDWVSSFETMFNNNLAVMSASCAQFGVADNSEDELNDLSSSIQSVGSSTGVDPRFILAIVLQESNGCVRAPTTNGGVVNPGLMQSHDGAGTCNDATVSNPCPASEITQMIQDGTAGTSSGDGLAQCITASGATDVSMYYKAARIYNSGSVAAGGNLGAGIATHCYASDVANRLTGWFSGPSSCIPATIGDLTGAASGGSAATAAAPEPTTPAPAPASSGGVFAAIPTPAVQPTPTPDAPAASTVTVVPIPSSTAASPPPAATSSSPTPATAPSSSAPVYFGVISSCQEYYTVQPGDYCILVEGKFGISMSQLQTWNSGLETDCSNLWLGYQYCVQA